jgi:hypothetical protein
MFVEKPELPLDPPPGVRDVATNSELNLIASTFHWSIPLLIVNERVASTVSSANRHRN